MSISTVDFRRKFPEFINQENYPGPVVEMWLDVATRLLPAERWTTVLDVGVYLFTAHNLAMETKAMNDAAHGKAPGNSSGPISSKSIGSVSVSYDTGAGLEVNSGHWNDTQYGRRFIRLAKMMGAGPITPVPTGVPGEYDGAWPGVSQFGSM